MIVISMTLNIFLVCYIGEMLAEQVMKVDWHNLVL